MCLELGYRRLDHDIRKILPGCSINAAHQLALILRLSVLIPVQAQHKNLERDLKKRVATFLSKQQVATIVEPGWGNPKR
jgi:hypothetical protein